MKINAINFLKLIFILFDCFILFNNCGGKNVGESQSSNKQFQINVSGTVYEDMGNQQYSPVNNALICDTEGNQLAVTNSSGFFSFNSFPESEKNLLVRLSGYYQSSTIINASENREVNFYIQKLDEKINEFGTSGPSGVIGYFRKAYNLLRSNSPAQFVYESNDKKAQITIKNWSLSKNVHLVLTAFNKSFNIPHLQKLREIDQGIIAAAADISILTGEGSTLVNSDEAGFSGIVEPKLRFQFSPYENWDTIKSILNGEAYAGSGAALKVYYLYNDNWLLAGEGILKYENGIHYFTTKANASIPKIAPIAFVMERPQVRYIVSGKVTDALTLKPVQEAEIFCENAERTVFTDSSGFYSLSAVIPFHSATIDLTCRKKNYYLKTGIVKFNTIEDTNYKTLNFSLELIDSAVVQGTVKNSLGSPVQGAEVTLMNYSAFANISVSYVLKSLTIADIQNAIYQWSYKNQDMDEWSVIAGASSNVIYETAIINQLKLDGNYFGAFKLKAKVNYGSYSEEEEIAVFDANIKPSQPAAPSGYKSVSLWGGEDRGYFFAAIPFGAQVEAHIWRTGICWTNQYGYDSSIIPSRNSQSQNLKMIELYDFIGSNIDAIKKNSPLGNPYLSSGLKLNVLFEVGYGNYENYDTSASLIFNIAESGLHLTNLRLLTGNLTAKHFKTFTNERGEYVFEDVPLIFSNKINVFSDKNGYIKSDEQPVGILSSSQKIIRNLILKAVNSVPAPPERFRLHLFGKSIIAEWSESKFASSYKIYYGIDKNNLSSFYTVNDTASRSFEFSGLSNNDWYFAVTALNQYGESPKTSVIKYSHYILTGGLLTGTISYSGNRGTVSSLKPLFVYLYSYSNKYLSGYPVMSAEISENGGQFSIPDIQSGEYALIAGYNAESVSPDSIINSQISYIVYPDSKIADVKENLSIPFIVNNGGNINFNFIIDDKYINDVIPPQIVNISPEYYSNNVSVKPVISITFSEPMNPESFNHSGENKWLVGGAFNVNPPDMVIWSADKTILTYQWSSYSDSPYNYNTFYSASSRTDNFAPTDAAGNILVKYNYIFKTESRTDTSLAGYVRLNSINPDALNMLFGSIHSAYDNIYIPPNDPAHWKILAVDGYMQFAFTGKKDFIFHALGATSFNESYCYVNIYINGLLYLSNAFIDKYWNNYSIAGSNFSDGNNIVKIELSGSTQFWIDEAYIIEPSGNEIITPSPESNYLFTDTFATGNYNNWFKHPSSSANFSVVNNELRQSNVSAYIQYPAIIYPNGYDWKNYKFSIKARHISNYYYTTSINIYFRVQQNVFSFDNAPAGYCLQIQPGGFGGLYSYTQNNMLLVQKFSPDLTYPDYDGYNIQIEAFNNSIKISVDGKKVIDATDNTFDTGSIGLASVHCVAGFDDVIVEAAE